MADEDKTTEQLLEELQAARQEIANARSLADNSRDNIMRYDRQLRHIFVNRAALEVTGISASEALGKTHRELGFPAALCDLWEARIASVFDTGESAQVEFDVELPGGKVWLDLRLHPELDADGGVCSVLAVSRDITDRKHAEESLRQRTAELEALFQASPDLSFRLSSDGTILDFHTGRASDLYTTPDKFLGRRMQDVLPADVGQQFQQAYEQALDGATVSLEYALAVPSGAKVFEARVIPLPDNQVYVLVRDITDRKRAQEERSALEAQLQQAQRLEGLGVLASGIAHDFNNLLVGIYGNMDLALRGLEEGSSTLRYIANAKMAAKRAADLIGQMPALLGGVYDATKGTLWIGAHSDARRPF